MSKSQSQDFTPPPTYSQSKTSNESWINVTTTKVEGDGSITQSQTIISKR